MAAPKHFRWITGEGFVEPAISYKLTTVLTGLLLRKSGW